MTRVSATFATIACPVCGALIVLLTTEEDGLLAGECAACGARLEKRKGEEPKVQKPC